MLAKINRIKRLGLVFKDFTWTDGVPPFQKVNLVYGWNGFGKTTLTRLFDLIDSAEEGDTEYELEDAEGAKFGLGQTFGMPVRVFNQHYIANNVRILESRANTISVLLGHENKELSEQIDADEKRLYGNPDTPKEPGLIAKERSLDDSIQRIERDVQNSFTTVAREIGAAIAGSSNISRTYRRPDAERDFRNVKKPASLSNEELETANLTLHQEVLAEIATPEPAAVTLDGRTSSALPLVEKVCVDAQTLCQRVVDAIVIERLAANPDITEWVEHGIDLHTKHESGICEYCGNKVSGDRMAELGRHFSEADRALKAEIDDALETLRLTYDAIKVTTLPDEARLYQELRADFADAVHGFDEAKAALLESISTLEEALKEKKLRTTEPVGLDVEVDTIPFSAALSAVSDIVKVHNDKAAAFSTKQQEALGSIKKHYLSSIHTDVLERRTKAEQLQADLDQVQREITDLTERVTKSRAQISSAHQACVRINDGLKNFLGHGELTFDVQPDGQPSEMDAGADVEGYRILRRGEPAAHLSEGEKTAIAFIYFLVHLHDGQFDHANGIVVIDDPISSLDSNSLYQAFSFLKNAILDTKQVFILTHNFAFLKLLLNWRSGSRERHTGYYMLGNQLGGDGIRSAQIVEMDQTLRKYESEYHYLFKRLKEMRVDQDGTIAKAYPVPNMARKLWDTFLMFRVPNGEGSYRKMEVLKEAGIDAQKLDAIYKFTNDQSHITGDGFDPALVPETEKVLGIIFDVMKETAPDHFKILDESTN